MYIQLFIQFNKTVVTGISMMNKPIPALRDLLDWPRRQAYKQIAAIQLDQCASRGMSISCASTGWRAGGGAGLDPPESLPGERDI